MQELGRSQLSGDNIRLKLSEKDIAAIEKGLGKRGRKLIEVTVQDGEIVVLLHEIKKIN